MSTNDTAPGENPLFEKWNGQLVPWSYEGGFIALSFVVSLIGAATTLELIQRRTAQTGRLNNALLVGAAISMGGVAIWSMHYVGNRAIIMAHGEPQIQIAYSTGFTVLSLFVPILVLLAAFIASGTKDRVSWWRICIGGTLAGLAICGMHYLGNASISNYTCEYDVINVVAAAAIAVVASSVALAIFFVFRATWTSSWWKRTISEIILAGAVSGMHWCASGGTHYRLIALRSSTSGDLDRNTTVIIVICLAVGASIFMAGLAIYLAYAMKRYASRAQKIQLAAAIFDDQGRVLVNRDGLLPSEKITDSFIGRTPQETLGNAHPLFHWMFQVSRNWQSVAPLIDGMSAHLARLSRNGGIQLATSNQEPVKDYDNIIRELFCVTAATLAAKLKTNLDGLGVLWDERLTTGGAPLRPVSTNTSLGREESILMSRDPADMGLAEKGFRFRVEAGQDVGRGSLLFLIRRVQSGTEMECLEAAGFRFAELFQVSNNISTRMQIRTRELETKLRCMSLQAEQSQMLDPGLHLGLFGVRSRSGVVGFDVLVRKGASNLLPSVAMKGSDVLAEADKVFMAQLDGMSINVMLHVLENGKYDGKGSSSSTPEAATFAERLADALGTLRGWVDDPVLSEAMVTSKVVEIPCSPEKGSDVARTATMIALRIVIPTSHQLADTSRCEVVPLGLFRVQQIAYKGSPYMSAFARSVRGEIEPLMDRMGATATEDSQPRQSSRNKYAKLESPKRGQPSESAVELRASRQSDKLSVTPVKRMSRWTQWRRAAWATRDVEQGRRQTPQRLSKTVESKPSTPSLKRTSSISDMRPTSPAGRRGSEALGGATALGCSKCGRRRSEGCCSRCYPPTSASSQRNEVEMTPMGSPQMGRGRRRGESVGAGSLGSAFQGSPPGGGEPEKGLTTFVDELFTMRRY